MICGSPPPCNTFDFVLRRHQGGRPLGGVGVPSTRRMVEILDEHGEVADNEAADFVRMLRKTQDGKGDKTRHWAFIWMRPSCAMPNGRCRFQVKVQGQSPKRSKPFSVDLAQTDRPHAIEAEQ